MLLSVVISSDTDTMKISARNVLQGKVISIVTGPVSTELTLEVAPGVRVTSSITSTSAQSLGLKEGDNAYAVIKASSWIKQLFCLSKEAPKGAFLIQPVQISWMR